MPARSPRQLENAHFEARSRFVCFRTDGRFAFQRIFPVRQASYPVTPAWRRITRQRAIDPSPVTANLPLKIASFQPPAKSEPCKIFDTPSFSKRRSSLPALCGYPGRGPVTLRRIGQPLAVRLRTRADSLLPIPTQPMRIEASEHGWGCRIGAPGGPLADLTVEPSRERWETDA